MNIQMNKLNVGLFLLVAQMQKKMKKRQKTNEKRCAQNAYIYVYLFLNIMKKKHVWITFWRKRLE